MKIIKNGELLGKGEVQLMSFINHSDKDFPSLEEFINETDPVKQKSLIEEAIKQVAQSRVLMPIHKIKDNSIITFGDTGYIVYESEKIPADFSWQIVAVEKDGKIRENAELAESLLTKDNVNSILEALKGAAVISGTVVSVVPVLFDTIIKSAITIFKNDRDDQVGYFLASFIRDIDYQHGDRNRQDVVDLTGNMFVDYSFWGAE